MTAITEVSATAESTCHYLNSTNIQLKKGNKISGTEM